MFSISLDGRVLPHSTSLVHSSWCKCLICLNYRPALSISKTSLANVQEVNPCKTEKTTNLYCDIDITDEWLPMRCKCMTNRIRFANFSASSSIVTAAAAVVEPGSKRLNNRRKVSPIRFFGTVNVFLRVLLCSNMKQLFDGKTSWNMIGRLKFTITHIFICRRT